MESQPILWHVSWAAKSCDWGFKSFWYVFIWKDQDDLKIEWFEVILIFLYCSSCESESVWQVRPMFIITTKGALRRPMTYDNHPSHPHIPVKTTSPFTLFRSRNQISAKKWLLREPLLFLTEDNWMTLTFCQVIILLYTSSRLTKSSTLLSTPVSISTQQVPLVVF